MPALLTYPRPESAGPGPKSGPIAYCTRALATDRRRSQNRPSTPNTHQGGALPLPSQPLLLEPPSPSLTSGSSSTAVLGVHAVSHGFDLMVLFQNLLAVVVTQEVQRE